MIPCFACAGSGEEMDHLDFTLMMACEICGGSGEIPGTALVFLPHFGSHLITLGYVYAQMHAAKSFVDGWEAAADEYIDGFTNLPRYARLRDYLIAEFDTDDIVACLVALYLTRGEGARSHAHFYLTFHASFYEAESGRTIVRCSCGLAWNILLEVLPFPCWLCGALVCR